MHRSSLFLLPMLFLILLFPLSSLAASLSLGVQAVLRSAPAGEEVPVIINLSAKADLGLIKEKNKEKKREKIIKALKDVADLTQGQLRSLLQGRGAKRVIPFWITNSIAATIPPAVISELVSFPGIASIELDAVVPTPVVLPASASDPEWNIAKINAPALWNAGITGAGVVVANLDSGVDPEHADLHDKWRGNLSDPADPINAVSWYNPYADPANASECGTPNQCSPCELSASAPCDDRGHGTGTMGIMVGGSAGGTAIGVAPDAKWIAVKIFPSPPAPGALSSIILQGLQWVLGSAPDVVNNSWGEMPGICETSFQTAISNVKAAGTAIVFSAGNSGPFTSSDLSPANNPGAFAVGATDNSDSIASFSSRGPSTCDGSVFPHVVGPGVGVKLASLTGGGAFPNSYVYNSGTSFSAPHVAGAMTLLTSVFPSLIPSELETALEQTALHLVGPAPDDTVPNNIYGYGRIDVNGALAYITTQGNIAIPEIAGYPSSYDYGNVPLDATSTSHTFTVTNGGGGTLSVNSITVTGAHASEFVISDDSCSANTLAPSASCFFTVVVAPISTGIKTAQLSISYGDPATVYDVPLNGNVVDLLVRMQGTSIVATYHTIGAAFDDCAVPGNCADGDVIAARTATFTESPDFNAALNIGLQGGYDPSFGSQAGTTVINGTMTISSGTVTIGEVTLQ